MKKEYKNLINMALIIAYIMVISLNSFKFGIGYHNIDLAQNMRYMEERFNTTLYDYSSNNNLYHWENLYNIGYKEIVSSYFWNFILISVIIMFIYDFVKK